MKHDLNGENGPDCVMIVHDGPIPDRTSSKNALPFAHCAPITLSPTPVIVRVDSANVPPIDVWDTKQQVLGQIGQ